ncbi:nucleoside phosphorylase [Saccharicrinis sp. FJH54]|uniref:nucleoside phosphorylase n=1 Tax=Saccharicrinis sp. FJH54 TaxID=3344665 RepID=UPI0035D4B478
MRIPESELIINPDGSVFHLHIKPGELADKIILVGDPGRVATIANEFDRIESEAENREFVSKTGYFNGKHITVLSTGIGTDNIDIVLNELDALVNIDFETREINEKLKSLDIVRIGTSGGLHKDIPVDSIVMSERSIGFDGLLNFYEGRNDVSDLDFENYLKDQLKWIPELASPYVVHASDKLIKRLDGSNIIKGATISAPGFYGPQGRELRLKTSNREINSIIETFSYKGTIIANYEMESSAIAGLSGLLGHNAVTLCAIIANRVTKDYSKDYKIIIKELIQHVLELI